MKVRAARFAAVVSGGQSGETAGQGKTLGEPHSAAGARRAVSFRRRPLSSLRFTQNRQNPDVIY